MNEYRLIVKQGEKGRWRWQIINRESGKVAALPPDIKGHTTRGEAMSDGMRFVRGLRGQRSFDFRAFLLGATACAAVCSLLFLVVF